MRETQQALSPVALLRKVQELELRPEAARIVSKAIQYLQAGGRALPRVASTCFVAVLSQLWLGG